MKKMGNEEQDEIIGALIGSGICGNHFSTNKRIHGNCQFLPLSHTGTFTAH